MAEDFWSLSVEMEFPDDDDNGAGAGARPRKMQVANFSWDRGRIYDRLAAVLLCDVAMTRRGGGEGGEGMSSNGGYGEEDWEEEERRGTVPMAIMAGRLQHWQLLYPSLRSQHTGKTSFFIVSFYHDPPTHTHTHHCLFFLCNISVTG